MMMSNPREILKRSIEGKHAVQDVADIVGHPKEAENVDTLIESLQYRPHGDLVLAPDDHWSIEESLEDIRRFQGTGE